MAYRSGFKATATIAGNEPSVVGWNVGGFRATVVRFVNSKTGNHPRKGFTTSDSFFSIDIDWQDSENPFAAPLILVAGIFLSNVRLYLDSATGSLFWSYPSAALVNITQGAIVEGKISTRLECEADGPFAAPGGSVA